MYIESRKSLIAHEISVHVLTLILYRESYVNVIAVKISLYTDGMTVQRVLQESDSY